MSDPVWMSISIGGDLPKKLLDEFINTIATEGFEEGPNTVQELKGEVNGKDSIRWSGTTNYGECEDLKVWLKKHGLFYTHYYASNGEYSPGTWNWLPGLKKPTFQQADEEMSAIIGADKARGLVDLLMGVAKDGLTALPAFATGDDGAVKDIAEKVLSLKRQSMKDLLKRIGKYTDEILPVLPELPPLRIV